MGRWRRGALIPILTGASCLAFCPRAATAQASRTTTLDFTAGSELENYLRLLQVAGLQPIYPWSIRALSPRTITRLAESDSTGPWALRSSFRKGGLIAGSFTPDLTFNSAYPYGANDGAVWAGRGLTLTAAGGIAANLGHLAISLAPVAFVAANRPFDLLPNGETGAVAFNHASFPRQIDLPQRFGSGTYSRLDPGQSTIRFDSRVLSVGISTANEWIGPATEYPFLLGDNAPGFPHLFIGTGDPLNLWIARVHARLIWGKVYQSAYAPVSGPVHYVSPQDPGTVRLVTSGQLVLTPRGLRGLEIGLARFFHVPNQAGGLDASFWFKPFKVFFLKNEYAAGDSAGADNQLASAFFRWVFPHSGLEVYGERGYEDQFYDLRDFIEDPDHERAYMLGLQKAVHRSAAALDVFNAELVNYQLPGIARVRTEGLIYLHNILRQGHTNRGQLLGVSAGAGAAAASVVSWSRYSGRGRTSIFLRRIVRDQRGDYAGTGLVEPRTSDVIVSAGLQRMRFGRYSDFGWKVEAMQDFNHNFSKDVPNLNLQLTARLHAW
jgi:hypothetical protein